MKGYLTRLGKFKTLLGLHISIAVMEPCEILAKTLQSVDFVATEAKAAAAILVTTLQGMRSEEYFNTLWDTATEKAQQLELAMPEQSRQRRPPKRYEHKQDAAPPPSLSPKDNCRKEFYEVIDTVIGALNDRFPQPGLDRLVDLESILLNAASGIKITPTELTAKLGCLASEFNIEDLNLRLVLLPSVMKDAQLKSVNDIAKVLAHQGKSILELFGPVVKLIRLIMTIPASAAPAARSFSALKRVKTQLRNKTGQERLANLLLLHAQKDLTSSIDIRTILRQFISKTTERTTVFGKV